MEIRKIYFDMDGVLADFSRGVKEICGMEPVDQKNGTEEETEKLWNAVKAAEHFYDRLEPVPGAVEMFQKLSSLYDCEILTAIPRPKRQIKDPDVDKRKWVRRVISPTTKVNICYRKEKCRYAEDKGFILIDDLESNVKAWNEAGGTGIIFTDAESVLTEIDRIKEL